MHQPRILEHPGSRDIVVFIHGFMGSPRQFDELADSVHGLGYSAASLLLPGHGTTAKAFSACNAEAWTEHVTSELNRYERHYANLWLAGHSLGCLLALQAAARGREHIRGLFLLACPMIFRSFSPQTAKVRFQQAIYPASHPMKTAYRTGSGVPVTPSLLWRSVKPGWEVKRLAAEAREWLPHVRVPVTAVFSSGDELVSPRSLDVLMNGLPPASLTSMLLRDSLHAYVPVHERAILKNALQAMLAGEGVT